MQMTAPLNPPCADEAPAGLALTEYDLEHIVTYLWMMDAYHDARDGWHLWASLTNCYHWLGFSARAVEFDKPFLSETGYRSFIAISGELEAGFTPDRFAGEVISAYV